MCPKIGGNMATVVNRKCTEKPASRQGGGMRFLRLVQVLDLVAMGRSAWYERVLDGRAPPPTKIGTKIAVWPENVISQYQSKIVSDGECVGQYSAPGGLK